MYILDAHKTIVRKLDEALKCLGICEWQQSATQTKRSETSEQRFYVIKSGHMITFGHMMTYKASLIRNMVVVV